MESAPKKKEETKQNKFDWADEGLSALVRVVILSWSAAILTLNYVTIPGVCLLYTSPSPRDATLSRMPSSA